MSSVENIINNFLMWCCQLAGLSAIAAGYDTDLTFLNERSLE